MKGSLTVSQRLLRPLLVAPTRLALVHKTNIFSLSPILDFESQNRKKHKTRNKKRGREADQPSPPIQQPLKEETKRNELSFCHCHYRFYHSQFIYLSVFFLPLVRLSLSASSTFLILISAFPCHHYMHVSLSLSRVWRYLSFFPFLFHPEERDH